MHTLTVRTRGGRDRFHRLVDVLSVAGDGDVGIFFIEGLPLFVQLLDVFDVPAHDDAALCKAGDAPLHLFGAEFQINDGADLLQMPHGAVGIDDAAPVAMTQCVAMMPALTRSSIPIKPSTPLSSMISESFCPLRPG